MRKKKPPNPQKKERFGKPIEEHARDLRVVPISSARRIFLLARFATYSTWPVSPGNATSHGLSLGP